MQGDSEGKEGLTHPYSSPVPHSIQSPVPKQASAHTSMVAHGFYWSATTACSCLIWELGRVFSSNFQINSLDLLVTIQDNKCVWSRIPDCKR